MNEILKKAQQMQSEIKKSQEESKNKEYKGNSGGGMVEVTVNGANELKNINIDPSLFTEKGKEILEDLIIAAANNALKKAGEDSKGSLKNIAGNMGIPDNLF